MTMEEYRIKYAEWFEEKDYTKENCQKFVDTYATSYEEWNYLTGLVEDEWNEW